MGNKTKNKSKAAAPKDIAALNSAEAAAGVAATDASVAPATGKTETAKREPLNLDAKAENLGEFVKNSFNDYATIEKVEDFQAESTVVLNRKGKVAIVVIDSVEGNKVSFKETTLSKNVETIAFKDITEAYQLGSIARVNIKGDYSADLWKLVKACNAATDKTCKIGAILTDEEGLKSSENGKKMQQRVVDHFKEKFGVEVTLRFSKTAGKVQGRDGAGFAILAQNPDETKMTQLFKQGSHHYSKRKLFEIEPVGETDFNIVEECDKELKDMLAEVASMDK